MINFRKRAKSELEKRIREDEKMKALTRRLSKDAEKIEKYGGKFFFPVYVLALSLVVVSSLTQISYRGKKDELLSQTSQIADLDRNGYMSPEEWGRVYRFLGKTYDSTSNPHKDLMNSDLELYINFHK
jgi:hypothetical protein